MIDSIRRRQVDEELNYDKNMNLRVHNLERRAVAKTDEATELRSTKFQAVIG